MISIIVAMDRNQVIGKNDQLPWHIPEDLKRFKSLTFGKTVIMGRKTFESILQRLGKPLPGRTNVIVTHDRNYQAPKCVVVSSLEESFVAAGNKDAFIIGGAEVYRQTIENVDRLYVTWINRDYEGDAFFPRIEKQRWNLLSEAKGEEPMFPYEYWFRTYERK